MAEHPCWVIFDKHKYLIEYLGKTPGGISVSVNGSETNYPSIVTDSGERAWISCGKIMCRMDIQDNETVSLWIDDVERPILSDEWIEKFKPKIKKSSISSAYMIFVALLTIFNTGSVLANENNFVFRCGVQIAIIIFAAFTLLYFLAPRFESINWLLFGLITIEILVLLVFFFFGLDSLDLRNFMGLYMILFWITHVVVRMVYIIVLLVHIKLAIKLFDDIRGKRISLD